MGPEEELATYFKANPAFGRFVDTLKHKYERTGELAGRIVLEKVTVEERLALGGLLGDPLTGDRLSLPFDRVDAAVERLRFGRVDWARVLAAYYGAPVSHRRAARERRQRDRQAFFTELAESFSGSPAEAWLLSATGERRHGYQLMTELYSRGEDGARAEIQAVCRALDTLPSDRGERVPLAVFAAELTGNPHKFDRNTACGRLLVAALKHRFRIDDAGDHLALLTQAYHLAGLEENPLNNFVAVYGLELRDKVGPHPAFQAFLQRREDTLLHLNQLEGIMAAAGTDGRVLVVENPGVYQSLLPAAKKAGTGLVCTGGQLGRAAIRLLTLLGESGGRLYYSGDFDPEGLIIAQHVHRHCRGNIRLWGYDRAFYEMARSEESISARRLAILDNIELEQLEEISALLRKDRVAGYQEMLVGELARLVQNG